MWSTVWWLQVCYRTTFVLCPPDPISKNLHVVTLWPGNWGSQLELMAICQAFGVTPSLHILELRARDSWFRVDKAAAAAAAPPPPPPPSQPFASLRSQWSIRRSRSNVRNSTLQQRSRRFPNRALQRSHSF